MFSTQQIFSNEKHNSNRINSSDFSTNSNLDPLTETFGLTFYLHYLVRWPDCFIAADHSNGDMMAYIMGKVEGQDDNWHGHVTGLSVASIFRRINLAAKLMFELETVFERKQAYFIDLFVRQSNQVALIMYERLGYSVYRRVLDYYSGDPDEDAFDMRKALSRDIHKRTIKPLPHPVRACDL